MFDEGSLGVRKFANYWSVGNFSKNIKRFQQYIKFSFPSVWCVEGMNEHISMLLLCSVLNHQHKPDLFVMISSCIWMMSDCCFSYMKTSVMVFPPVSWLLWTDLNLSRRKLAGEFAKQTHVHHQIWVSFCYSFFFPRITRAYRVHSDFHARYRAVSRTYVYRFAAGLRHHTEMPVTEKDLCWALRDTWVPPVLFCTCFKTASLHTCHRSQILSERSRSMYSETQQKKPHMNYKHSQTRPIVWASEWLLVI